MQEIAKVLEDVEDWEGLAGWLRINDTTIVDICAASTTATQCHKRTLLDLEIYCEKSPSGDPYKVVSDVADVLESEMGMWKLAERLRELKFASVDSEWIILKFMTDISLQSWTIQPCMLQYKWFS